LIALVQRVLQASVSIGGKTHSAIEAGVLALVCAERGDTEREAVMLADKVIDFRLFADQQHHMNLSLQDAGHALLAVPQFTLAADTSRGRRPSFTPAAPPDIANSLFERFVAHARSRLVSVEVGVFGADMQVALVNDGPVTFWLRIAPSSETTT
jgi:D-tyrosyl-tRNA(Tyr) deacylase